MIGLAIGHNETEPGAVLGCRMIQSIELIELQVN